MNIEDMVKAAQEAAEKLQSQMTEANASLDKMEVDGASGGGLVKVRMSAKHLVLGLTIDDSLLQPSEKQMLEDLLAVAFNDARTKADTVANAEMSKLSAGLPLPPGMKLPF